MAESNGESKSSGCDQAARGPSGTNTDKPKDPKTGISVEYNDAGSGSGDSSSPEGLKSGLGLDNHGQE